jgi:hypothetical protein
MNRTREGRESLHRSDIFFSFFLIPSLEAKTEL